MSWEEHRGAWVSLIIVVIIFMAVTIFGGVVIIPQGSVGIHTTFGKVVGYWNPGLNFKKPLIDGVSKMSVKTQLFEVKNATAASKDLQDVTMDIAINYKILPQDAPGIYSTLGNNYIEVIAHPAIQEVSKQITAKHNAEDLIINREAVKEQIAQEITNRLNARTILVETVAITNFNFSKVFNDAIESKVAAQQAVFEAQNKLERIKVEAQQAQTQAVGQANATVALAEGQAQANTILQQSLTPTLIQYMFIQKIGQNDKVITVPGNLSLTLPLP